MSRSTRNTGCTRRRPDVAGAAASDGGAVAVAEDEPAPTDGAFFRGLIEHGNDLVAAFDEDGVFGYVSPSVARLLGGSPDRYLGRNFAEVMHPEDLERALFQAGQAEDPRSHSVFRLRHVDGSWVPLDISAGRANDGHRDWFVCFCRHAATPEAEGETFRRLLNGEPLDRVLAPIVDMFSWQELGSHIAITWADTDGYRTVSTGLPASLCGTADRDDPWSAVRRTGIEIRCNDLDGLDDATRADAVAHGRAGYWIAPVPVAGSGTPALVTAWTATGYEPQVHEAGMQQARTYVDVVLQFWAQRAVLDHAASHDPLTGLANRQAVVDALGAPAGGGAVLYLDLDRFKPVNDTLGHGAGDELLGLVARRLEACARTGDLVARLGGDEFVVVCRGIDRCQTEAMAERILEAVSRPFALGDHVVTIGASVGLALGATRLDESILERADRALYRAKAAGRGVARWAEP